MGIYYTKRLQRDSNAHIDYNRLGLAYANVFGYWKRWSREEKVDWVGFEQFSLDDCRPIDLLLS